MSTPTSLLFVTPSLGRGGAERHAVTMATTLDRRSWRPHVLTMTDGPLRAVLETDGIEVTVAGTGRGIGSVPAATQAVRRAVRRHDPAVISAHDILGELAARAAVVADRRPLVAWKHTYGHIGHRGRRDRAIERLSGRQVTRYGAVCHTQVRYLTDELGVDPSRIRVVPNSVPAGTATSWPSGPPVVAMVAAMRADKGHDTVLRAWATVSSAHPDARLVLVGDGPCRTALTALATELGIAASVEFRGELADPSQVVAGAHVIVLGSYAVECFPYAVLEAMARGRAVVSTDVGGLPELVDDGVTGLLVPPRDPVAMARALGAVVAEPGLARALGEAACERLARVYPFRRWVDQIGALFDDAASVGPHGPRGVLS